MKNIKYTAADATAFITRYTEDGILHREDGPALITTDGAQFWYKHGERHREDGPAIIMSNGTQEWWVNGHCHREDGPAIIYSDGTQEWRNYTRRHRVDGPAVSRPNGLDEWWVNDNYVYQWEEFRKLANLTPEQLSVLILKYGHMD